MSNPSQLSDGLARLAAEITRIGDDGQIIPGINQGDTVERISVDSLINHFGEHGSEVPATTTNQLLNLLAASSPVTPTTPTPVTPKPKMAIETWTILLKCKKTTVLVEMEPLATIEDLKNELINMLKSLKTPPLLAKFRPLPTHTRQILLAQLNDPRDVSKGWSLIDYIPHDHEQIDELAQDQVATGKGKGKGKAKVAVPVATSDALGPLPPGDSRTLREVGMTDSCRIAFTWTSAVPGEDGDVDMSGDVELDEDGKPVFDVTMPSMDEAYGTQEG